MIVDLPRFIDEERPYWRELDALLLRLERDIACRLDLAEIQRLHYLYQRASSDLTRLATFSADPEVKSWLEALVARAYGHMHSGARHRRRFRFGYWLLHTFPATFRRHRKAFHLALAVTAVGMLFGGGAIALDPAAKPILLPFENLQGDPAKRVAEEERGTHQSIAGREAPFAAMLMTHNARVSVLAMALGMTWGIGTIVLLFYNGVILGAVCLDYLLAGQGVFLAGWLLPHGAVEIPAILLGSQAGLVLAGALIGRGSHQGLRQRLRLVGKDVVTLVFGTAIMLIWAGFVEAFFSQYHQPVIPYGIKIAFGLVELVALAVFLLGSGRQLPDQASTHPSSRTAPS